MIYITNSFSLNILPPLDTNTHHLLEVTRISPAMAADILANHSWQSAIGHSDMAMLVSRMLPLGHDIPANRVNVSMDVDDIALVAQYSGPRLPAGASRLPNDAEIRFYAVGVSPA